LRVARDAGFKGDDGEAGNEEDDANGVQRFVECEGMIDRRRSAQVTRC